WEGDPELVGDGEGDAVLEARRNAGKGGRAPRRAHREAPRLAALDGTERGRRGGDDEVDLPRLQRDARVAHALVGNVSEIHARVRIEELAHDVDDAADAGRAEVELPRPRARRGDERGEAFQLRHGLDDAA